MKQRILIISITIPIAVILFLIGYAILTPQPSAVLSPIENATSLYSNAISKIDSSEDAKFTVNLTKEMTVDGHVFQEISYQTVNYDMQSSGSPFIQMHEERQSGTHTIEITEIFADDTVYLTVNDTPFSSACNIDQYKSTLIPAIIISPHLYCEIEGVDTGSGYMITFSESTNIESWLTNSSATLIEAKGVARLNYDGDLESSLYTASYQLDRITFRITAEVCIRQERAVVTPPNNVSIYTPITDWQAPKYLEQACGYLIQAKQITADYSDNIYFEAIGDHRSKRVILHANFEDEWSVFVSTDTTTRNETKLDQALTHRKKELFLKGQYQVSNDDEPAITNPSISIDTVCNYFQNQLVSTAMLPQHINSAEIVDDGNTIHILFTGTEAFGYFLAENACHLLYNDPNLITKTGSEFTSNDLRCYLDIDKTTGLPLASGIDFTGRYKTEGIPYSLKYRADQTYVTPSREAKKEIQKAAD